VTTPTHSLHGLQPLTGRHVIGELGTFHTNTMGSTPFVTPPNSFGMPLTGGNT
jgi:hypothetical protein